MIFNSVQDLALVDIADQSGISPKIFKFRLSLHMVEGDLPPQLLQSKNLT